MQRSMITSIVHRSCILYLEYRDTNTDHLQHVFTISYHHIEIFYDYWCIIAYFFLFLFKLSPWLKISNQCFFLLIQLLNLFDITNYFQDIKSCINNNTNSCSHWITLQQKINNLENRRNFRNNFQKIFPELICRFRAVNFDSLY